MTSDHEQAQQAADTMLIAARLAIDLVPIQRIPRYRAGHRENNAEHCFNVGLVLPEIAYQHFPHLSPGLVGEFALVHELAELITGDVATFGLHAAAIRAKEADDAAAAVQLIPKLPPYMRSKYIRYKNQIEPEARFVRLGEKALVIAVDILGPGQQVMAEDYGVTTATQLEDKQEMVRSRLQADFPDTEFRLLHQIWDVLAARFRQEFS